MAGERNLPSYTHLIIFGSKCKMKKISFETLFLLFSVLLAISTDWAIYSSIIVICASLFMLVDVVPKLWRFYHASKGN